jgi:hypothetical protein
MSFRDHVRAIGLAFIPSSLLIFVLANVMLGIGSRYPSRVPLHNWQIIPFIVVSVLIAAIALVISYLNAPRRSKDPVKETKPLPKRAKTPVEEEWLS